MREGQPTVDMLPDMTEVTPEERCATPWESSADKAVSLYTAQDRKTVDRHFAWMRNYGIDGAALQRFATELMQPEQKAALDHVLDNVRAATEHYGRTFYIEYDMTGIRDHSGVDTVMADWRTQLRSGTTRSAAYQRHKGHVVVAVFGLGFAGSRYVSAALGAELIAGIREASHPYGGVTIIAGVPRGWRSLVGNVSQDPDWAGVYKSVDILSPWVVGSYHSEADADRYRTEVMQPDMIRANEFGVQYLPVVFPGFSWHNLWSSRGDESRPYNQIPRQCGRFFWRQVYNVVDAGNTMGFAAMFDEVDEGTALFKTVADRSDLPAQPAFLALDADGCHLPSDWYLRLTGAATAVVKGKARNTPKLPLPLPDEK